MFNRLKKFLTTHDIGSTAVGQSYKASAVSKIFNGLQPKVAAESKLVKRIPCTGRSLNLIVKDGTECCVASVAFFDFPKIYAICTFLKGLQITSRY